MSICNAVTTKYYNNREIATEALWELADLLLVMNAAPGTAGTQGNTLDRLKKLIKRHEDEMLTVAVLALAKSGKSTFLNAIVGAELLPSNNVPETARICRLHHDVEATADSATLERSSLSESGSNRVDGITEDAPPLAVGVASIQAELCRLNDELRQHAEGAGDVEEVLNVRIAIPALTELGLGQSSDVTLQLFDTPGPNESGVAEVRHKVERLLEEMDVVIYLLDYTKLKTTDEEALLATLQSINPQLVERLASRLFFVVNKMDVALSHGGLSQGQTQEYVAELITNQMQVPGFSLKPDQVFCVSSLDALLSRLVLTGRADHEAKKLFCAIQFGRRRDFQKVSEAEYLEAARDVFPQTGLGQLEDELLRFLHDQGSQVKLMATTDDLTRLVDELSNSMEVSQAVLQQRCSEIQRKVTELRGQLDGTVERFGAVKGAVGQVEQKVTKKIVVRLEKLRVDLNDKVRFALGLDDKEGKTGPLKGLWKMLASAAGSLLRSKCSTQDEGHLRGLLQEVLQHINEAMAQEIKDCLHQVEVDAKVEQKALFGVVNKEIAVLAARMEAVLQEQLRIELKAAELKVEPPSAEQFHQDVQHIIDKGIKRSEVDETRTRWSPGLCGWGQEEVVEKVTYYELEGEEIAAQVGRVVDGHVDASIKAVKSVVHQIIEKDVESAQQQLSSYAQRYVDVMEEALRETEKGEAHRQEALQSVHSKAQQLSAIREKIARLRSSIESTSIHQGMAEEEQGVARAPGQARSGTVALEDDGAALTVLTVAHHDAGAQSDGVERVDVDTGGGDEDGTWVHVEA